MGRHKKEETDIVEDNSKNSSLENMITQEFGNVIVNGNYITSQNKTIISISPAINMILGGGIVEGSYMVLTGPCKAGKTHLALNIARNAQQEKYGSREIYYINSEGRIKSRDLLGVKNLNLDKFHIIQSEKNHILHASNYLDIAEKIINTVPKCVIIIDSFSALCDESELLNSVGDMQRAPVAKLQAKFCRKTCGILPIMDSILIGVTHQQANISGYGSPICEKVSNALLYQTDCKLKAKSYKLWKTSDEGQVIGQTVLWECTVSNLNTPPGSICTSFIRYGYGVDEITEVLTLCVDLNIIKKGGSWLELPNGVKAQGLENARKIVLDTPNLYEELYDKVKTMLNF